MRVDYRDSARVDVACILTEMDYGKTGAQTFVASEAVIDWGAVKAQMMYVHGCAKLVKHAG